MNFFLFGILIIFNKISIKKIRFINLSIVICIISIYMSILLKINLNRNLMSIIGLRYGDNRLIIVYKEILVGFLVLSTFLTYL